ncbi:MAG TPA: hypothetical protein VL048_21130 [Xanthobacteraceae bacterium]|nr:hypothetical protein [Xanthobacteraceae bacterium]
MKFDHSTFQYDAEPGEYYLVVAGTAKASKKVDGLDSHVLTPVPATCHALLSFIYYVPTKKTFSTYFTSEITLTKNDYAVMLAQLTVTEDKVDWFNPSADSVAWLHDQIAHAEKENPEDKTLVR